MIELRTGAQPAAAREALEDLKRELLNTRGTAPSAEVRLSEWRKWSSLAPARARAHLTDQSIRQVILGPQFAMLQNIAARDYGPGLHFLIDAEIETRLLELEAAIKQIEDTIRLWGYGRIAVILDTTVVLAAGPRVAKISWDEVLNGISRKTAFVVPIQVVEELDGLKDRGNAEARSNARFALKWLSDILDSGNSPRPFRLEKTQDSEATILVWVDDNGRVPLAAVDRDIIDCAQQLQPFTKKTVIASMDRSMVFRARTDGLSAALLTGDHIPERTNPVEDE